jgi:hypothetical protein
MISTTLFPRTPGLLLLSAIAVLVVAAPIKMTQACEVCLRPPQVPFTSEYPAAMEIAMATREALESGLIDAAAPLPLTITPNARRIDDVSPQQLIKMWAQSQPMRHQLQLVNHRI